MDYLIPNDKSKIYFAIDPGVHTGLAIYMPIRNVPDKTVSYVLAVRTTDLWGVVDIIHAFLRGKYVEISRLVVYLESPDKNPPVFRRGLSRKIMEKIAQNVGANKREAQLLRARLRGDWHLKVIDIVPKKSKPTRESIETALGLKLPLYNQHVLDAVAILLTNVPEIKPVDALRLTVG